MSTRTLTETVRRITTQGAMATFEHDGTFSAAADEAVVTTKYANSRLARERDRARRLRIRCTPVILTGTDINGREAYLLGYRHTGTCCYRTVPAKEIP